MNDDRICVFCGQKPGIFQNASIWCANVEQPACKTCERELKDLEEVEVCRRALVRGIAVNPNRLKNRIALIEEAENHRPTCLRCGGLIFFMKVQALDNSPMVDSMFYEPFRVLPAYCDSCGKFEFYHPDVVKRDKYLVYLSNKDTQED